MLSLIEELRPAALLANPKRAPTAEVQRKRVRAYTALVAELLLNHLKGIGPAYHQMSKSSFAMYEFGYDIFKKVVDVCCAENLIEIQVGFRTDGESVATTIQLSKRSLSHFEHWLREKESSKSNVFVEQKITVPLVRAKYKRPPKIKGKKQPAKEVPTEVLLQRDEVIHQWRALDQLNHFYDKHQLDGIRFHGLQRIYNNYNPEGPLLGGRFYAIGQSYQGLPSGQRTKLRIDGEQVCEIDVKSSQLLVYAFVKAATSNKKMCLPNLNHPSLLTPTRSQASLGK